MKPAIFPHAFSLISSDHLFINSSIALSEPLTSLKNPSKTSNYPHPNPLLNPNQLALRKPICPRRKESVQSLAHLTTLIRYHRNLPTILLPNFFDLCLFVTNNYDPFELTFPNLPSLQCINPVFHTLCPTSLTTSENDDQDRERMANSKWRMVRKQVAIGEKQLVQAKFLKGSSNGWV